MAADDASQWFNAVFVGAWIDVPTALPVPADIAEESRQGALRWLAPAADPHRSSVAPSQRMFLGLQHSPDKLLSSGAGTLLVETLHHFIVSRAGPPRPVPTRRHEALLAARTELVPLLAKDAAKLVDKALTDALALAPDADLPGLTPIQLSLPGPPLAGISSWSDGVGLFWFEDRVRVDFLKVEAHGAAPLFRPGLDWFPADLRRRFGARNTP